MGRDKVCNFIGEIFSGEKSYTTGVDTLEQARQWLACDTRITKVILKPQTSRAIKLANYRKNLTVCKQGLIYSNY